MSCQLCMYTCMPPPQSTGGEDTFGGGQVRPGTYIHIIIHIDIHSDFVASDDVLQVSINPREVRGA